MAEVILVNLTSYSGNEDDAEPTLAGLLTPAQTQIGGEHAKRAIDEPEFNGSEAEIFTCDPVSGGENRKGPLAESAVA